MVANEPLLSIQVELEMRTCNIESFTELAFRYLDEYII